MQLIYEQAELLTEHDYVGVHEINGQKLHGGFDKAGNYIPPRSKVRVEAVKNWTKALQSRGGDLLNADASLLSGPRMPNVEQQRLLIRHGLGNIFWNVLTVTGKIEARGKMLAVTPFPDLQDCIDEDISEMAIGHLNKGLLIAHGVDEGGVPEKGIGGHDQMWFIARDLVFGKDAYPDAEPPASIGRTDAGQRNMPELSLPVEGYLSFLMNLLLIEFRAEIGFAAAQDVMRTEGLFDVPSEDSLLAAEIIERIRTDERIHVESLRLYLGELCTIHFKTESNGLIPGHEIVDRYWQSLVQWATVDQPKLTAQAAYTPIRDRILESGTNGASLLKQFDAVGDVDFQMAAGG